MDCSTPGFTVLYHLPELAQTHVSWVGDAIQPSHPLSSPSPLPSFLPSIRVFPNESALHIRWPKDWSFSFNVRPSNEHPGLISFRMDWLALLAVQGTLKSLLQHHSSKPSILWHSAFFMAQLSYPYMTTGNTILHFLICKTFYYRRLRVYRQNCNKLPYTHHPNPTFINPYPIMSILLSSLLYFLKCILGIIFHL